MARRPVSYWPASLWPSGVTRKVRRPIRGAYANEGGGAGEGRDGGGERHLVAIRGDAAARGRGKRLGSPGAGSAVLGEINGITEQRGVPLPSRVLLKGSGGRRTAPWFFPERVKSSGGRCPGGCVQSGGFRGLFLGCPHGSGAPAVLLGLSRLPEPRCLCCEGEHTNTRVPTHTRVYAS